MTSELIFLTTLALHKSDYNSPLINTLQYLAILLKINSSIGVLSILVPVYPFKSVLSHKTNYIRCRAQCRMKIWSHFSKFVNDLWQWQAESIKPRIEPFRDSGPSTAKVAHLWCWPCSPIILSFTHWGPDMLSSCLPLVYFRLRLPESSTLAGLLAGKSPYLQSRRHWGNIKYTNIGMVAFPERKKKRAEITFEEIME